ncbi:hypothetical protein [Vreelandella nigrificans]|uniref:Uncharacterized protein n=1 Tax=Vreelandella nigrificans TaxID=2042704 RepID=A0A2A4HP11_9GAMM|nr:hypothetical protein [Halomonas nigrificans]PCF95774.1 hypothetical protein CPA45_10340 [Halomonas nigrificans]
MKAFSIILIRVLALYIALKPLLALAPMLFGPGSTSSYDEWMVTLIAMIAMPIIVGVVLWFVAKPLANKVHPTDKAEVKLPLTELGLVRAGSFLIGVYLTLQHIGIAISQWIWSGSIAYGPLAVIALGVGLIVGANFMGKLYKKIRCSGGEL